MIFQGQEFLEDDWFHDKDPLDWSKKDRFAGIWRLYRDLIALRRNRAGRTAGLCGQGVDVFHVDQAGKVIAYNRWADGGPGDSVVVVANFSHQRYDDYAITFPAPGVWQVRFNGDGKDYDASFGDDGRASCEACEDDDGAIRARLTLPPYTALVLSQDG